MSGSRSRSAVVRSKTERPWTRLAAVRAWQLNEIEMPDGTRSPVVLHSEDSRAVLLRLAPGQALGEHQVRERAWVVVLEGTVDVVTGGETHSASAGTLLEFEPTERRTVRSDEGARLLLLLAPWPGPGHYPST
jgi:quercetin dioxygenase-like cupin family protein